MWEYFIKSTLFWIWAVSVVRTTPGGNIWPYWYYSVLYPLILCVEVYFAKANKETLTHFQMVLGTRLKNICFFIFQISRWEDALDIALKMMVCPPIRHMMHVCHGHFFLFTLCLHWPPQGLNHTWCIKSTAFTGRILMVEVCWILLFIVYWLQAWKSYAPRAGSMHILTQGRESVAIYCKSRKWVLCVRLGECAYVSVGLHMAHLSLNFTET